MSSDYQPGQNVVIVQTFKTYAFHNGKGMGTKLKFAAGRKGTCTRVLDMPKSLLGPARLAYVFILPYGATRYEVRLSLEEAQKFLVAEIESSNQVTQQIQQPQVIIPAPQFSRVDEIIKLAELREKGLLTEEEFTIEKAQILNQPISTSTSTIEKIEYQDDKRTSSDTNIDAYVETSFAPTHSVGNYYLWILGIRVDDASKHPGELERILGLPEYVNGIKPKHQPEITAQRNQIIDLTSLWAFTKTNKSPARFNKLLSRNDAEGLVSQLHQIGFDAEIRPS